MSARNSPRASRDVVWVTLFMAAILLAFVAQAPAIIVAGSVLCAVVAYLGRSCDPATHDELRAIALICALLVPALLNPYHGLSPIFYAAATLAALAAAQVVSRKPPAVLLAAFRRIYGASIGAIALILFTYWGEPEPFGMVIEGSSTNGIPAYLIVIQIGVSLSSYLVNRRLPVLSTLTTGVVAFFGVGRGSLVVAGLIIAGTLLFNLGFASRSPASIRIYSVVLFFTVAAALVLYGEQLFEWIASYTKLSVGLVDENRLEIWDDYWSKLDPLTFLLGGDYSGTIIEREYYGNPHIAYIRTHSFFGLPLTVLAMVSPVLVFLSNKALTAKLVFGFFIGLAALRAWSEPLFFPTLLDFFYFTYFLLYFRYAPVGRNARPKVSVAGAMNSLRPPSDGRPTSRQPGANRIR